MQKHPASFFTFFTELAEGKCNRQGLQCSKTTCGSTGMEPGFVSKIHFARYDRRELDTYYRAPWIFGAVPGGNGSASSFRLIFAKFHLDLHLSSTHITFTLTQ